MTQHPMSNVRNIRKAKLPAKAFAKCKRITSQKLYLKWELRRLNICTNLVPCPQCHKLVGEHTIKFWPWTSPDLCTPLVDNQIFSLRMTSVSN